MRTTLRHNWRAPLGAVLAVSAAAAFALISTGVAAAHVTAQPGTATKGDYAKISFRVPSESATAGTVKLEVTLPVDHPISSVRTAPIPGWTAQITKAPLNPPVQRGDTKITEAPRTITWTARPGTRIGPNEFVEFDVSMGPLPEDTDQLVFPAVQTYDDGKVVSWNQPQPAGAPEPEHPAPSVRLVAGSGGHHDAASADQGPDAAMAGMAGMDGAGGMATGAGGVDSTARWLGGIGLVLGVIGLWLGADAILRTRRSGRNN